MLSKLAYLTMADFNIDISKLPEDVRDKLAELDLELSEGNCCVLSNTLIIILIVL